MKKNHIVILVLSLILAVSGFFLYQWWQDNRSTNVWTLVPHGTVVALETNDIAGTWAQVYSKSVWENLSSIPEVNEVSEKIEALDSMSGKKGELATFLMNRQVIVSMHPVSSSNFGFVFYVPISSSKDRAFLNDVVTKMGSDNNYRKSQRNFQGIDIAVIKSKKDESTFSYLIHNNWLVGSYTPLLLEDVIRTLDEPERSFKHKNKEAFDLAKAGIESAQIYVDYSYFHRLLSLFAKQESYGLLQPIQHFASSSTLDINLSNQDVLINGFTVSQDNKDFINCFTGQKPQPFNVKRLVSTRTAVFYHFGFDKPKELKRALRSYWSANGLPVNQKWEEISGKYKVDLSSFYNWMNNEIGMSILESMNSHNPDRALYIAVKNPEEAKKALDDLVNKISVKTKDTVYHESFADIEIKQIDINQFPAILLGQTFAGFEQSFYSIINNYVVFANSIQALKGIINDIEREETWGKSIKQNLFLEQCLGESNISLFVNVPRFYNIFLSHASAKWGSFFNKYASQFKRFENGSVQFSYVDNKFYTSTVFKHVNINKESKRKEGFELVKRSQLEAKGITRPFVVRNHYDKSQEVVVQDSLKQIYLISKDGQLLWKKPLESEIVGEVFQIDYFNNGKLQLCFATKSKLHIIDRNGVEVAKFPVDFPSGTTADQLGIIDYNNSKSYRFLVSDVVGNIFMYDKTGANLEGWRPKSASQKLAAPVRHVRVKNRDYIIAVQEDGVVQMYTRKGENYKGFPLNLDGKITQPLFMDQGPTETSTRFTTITEAGKIIQFNLAGQITKEEQWVNPAKNSRFQLISDVFSRNWVVARQDNDRLAILDAEGNTIFQQSTPTNTRLSVQFYNYGAGNVVYAVTDHEQEFTYLYDRDGSLINASPIESGFGIGLTYSEASEKFKAYKVAGREASVISFK